MPLALYALTAGAFGIGVTEFVIMGVLLEVSRELDVTIAAPVLTAFTACWPRKQLLVGLIVIFVIGNAACALAPTYGWLMAARVLTALSHGTFFGVRAVVATGLVAEDKRASAIAIMFTGLTVATVLGVPFGTWLGQHYGWRSTFWAVTLVGIVALIVLAALVPQDRTQPEASDWRSDLHAIARRSVLLGLLTTVLGYASVFAAFTYISPLLTRISGFDDSAVSPIMLVFGGALVAGNLLGGRLADRNLVRAILGTLAVLVLVLGLLTFAFNNQIAAVPLTDFLGAAGFATVAPLQMWVLSKTEGAGQCLASSVNIGAFNLGNAIVAWTGGVVIDQGPGLTFVPLFAALFPAAAIAVVAFTSMAERRSAQSYFTYQPIGSHKNAD